MSTIEYWIQLEANPWDMCPRNCDRMTGQTIKERDKQDPVSVVLRSPVTGVSREVEMYLPLVGAFRLRRYTANWAAPDDRKVNPWDLNEPDPSDKGTMGTFPGPTLECSVGDKIIIHFRNLDMRTDQSGNLLPPYQRTHSLHPHGIVFKAASDGAFPLSPPDPSQPVANESAAWASVGVTGKFKQSDRVPGPTNAQDITSGGTFTYEWDTFGWPATAGVWLYHDHAVMDEDNVMNGAIGFLVIHNSADPDDVDIRLKKDPLNYDPEFLPPNGVNGGPTKLQKAKIDAGLLPHHLAMVRPSMDMHLGASITASVTDDHTHLQHLSIPVFAKPPGKALYLQLFHDVNNMMAMNGRRYLGNTPTMVAGTETVMRFGVMGMGTDFHTFHIHGHRWTIPGPVGTDPGTIMKSSQVQPVSQFEDTRLFGNANSFGFTIHEGMINGAPSFMRAGGPNLADAKGEWHMHCHVLDHMMQGMMGSLLVVDEGDLAEGLPTGVPMPGMGQPNPTTTPGAIAAMIMGSQFSPDPINIKAGDSVTWTNMDGFGHTVSSDSGSSDVFDSGIINANGSFTHQFSAAGTFHYHCNVHPSMKGTVVVS